MKSIYQRTLACALVAGGSISSLYAAPQTAEKSAVTIRRVAVLGVGSGFEIEVTASEPVTPRSQVVTGPDRLVIDFPNAVPGSDLHNVAVNRGEVNAIRVGLFAANPPVTRVVLDLKTAQSYQVFSSGKTVIVKLGGGQQAALPHIQSAVLSQSPARVATLVPASLPALLPAKPASKVEVNFQDGKLTIWADKATLAEVLYAVHRRTGADIPVPAGAEQEQVAASFGPGPAREVLAALLNGSRFNFIIVGSDGDATQLKSVLLTPRGGGISQPANYSPPPPTQADVEPPQQPAQAEPPTEQAAGEQQPPQQQQQQPPQQQ
jgi:hypothetical protein